MANEEHLKILSQGIDVWNSWRSNNREIRPDLSGAGLVGADLANADLFEAYLVETHLGGSNLVGAQLPKAILVDADLSGADLSGADLTRALVEGCDFSGAMLRGVQLSHAHLRSGNLEGAELAGARLFNTVFYSVDLSAAKGLTECQHDAGSCIDQFTMMISRNVPTSFWRGCGLPDVLIDYIPSMTGEAIQFYSCFISYSSNDQEFANRLHADLQDNGVRCWFAPHDLEIGGVIQEDIDRQIRLRDKVILILSKASVASGWVTREVKTALEEEKSGRRVLFPIRIDDAVMDTVDQWAHDIKRTRNIGDFTKWKEHDAYRTTFERVLRDLRAKR